MKIFVLTKASCGCSEFLTIESTETYKTIEEARKAMMDEVDEYIETGDDDEEWLYVTNEGYSETLDDENPTTVKLHCRYYDDEVVWNISEHEI